MPFAPSTAAETMRGSMAELNAELADRWGVEIQTRAGVNTGEIVVGSEVTIDGMVMGDVANVAARLQAAVGPGEIVVSGTTAQLVRSSVELEEIEPLTVKGKRDPVIAFRVVGLLAPDGTQVAVVSIRRAHDRARSLGGRARTRGPGSLLPACR